VKKIGAIFETYLLNRELLQMGLIIILDVKALFPCLEIENLLHH
jgi:hypothetical protein